MQLNLSKQKKQVETMCFEDLTRAQTDEDKESISWVETLDFKAMPRSTNVNAQWKKFQLQ